MPQKALPEDWDYVEFPVETNAQMVEFENSDMFECVFKVSYFAPGLSSAILIEDAQYSDKWVLAKENLIGERGYATSDLFIKHPEKDGLWKMRVVVSTTSFGSFMLTS